MEGRPTDSGRIKGLRTFEEIRICDIPVSHFNASIL